MRKPFALHTSFACEYCGEGFTADQWDDRHSLDTEDASGFLHEHCCEIAGPCCSE